MYCIFLFFWKNYLSKSNTYILYELKESKWLSKDRNSVNGVNYFKKEYSNFLELLFHIVFINERFMQKLKKVAEWKKECSYINYFTPLNMEGIHYSSPSFWLHHYNTYHHLTP